jgi:hypothetical protein
MQSPARSYLMASVAAVGASAIAIAPSVAPPPDVRIQAEPHPAARVVSKATVELLAALQPMSPRSVLSLASRTLSGTTAPVPPAAVAPQRPVALNSASDFVISAWNAVLPWIDYGVDLTDYVLGFIPGVSIIGDQVSIVYYSLVRPVANSFVVDLVAPVVNAPLNPASYVNGLVTLGSVTVTSLINLGINEFNYFFGWLIPPIPPIPLAAPVTTTPVAQAQTAMIGTPATAGPADQGTSAGTDVADVPASVKTAMKTAEAAAQHDTTSTQDNSGEAAAEIAPSAKPSTEDSAAGEAAAAAETPTDEVRKAEEPKTSPSSSTGVAAQGAVSGETNEKTTEPTKASNGDKKGDRGSTAKGAKGSSADSSATNGDGGAKHANEADKSEKKDATGKKE